MCTLHIVRLAISDIEWLVLLPQGRVERPCWRLVHAGHWEAQQRGGRAELQRVTSVHRHHLRCLPEPGCTVELCLAEGIRMRMRGLTCSFARCIGHFPSKSGRRRSEWLLGPALTCHGRSNRLSQQSESAVVDWAAEEYTALRLFRNEGDGTVVGPVNISPSSAPGLEQRPDGTWARPKPYM